ncbi:coiled-coil-helix-coiled-coil-helix domain-containing protein 5 [Octopus bimaculoides]|uniref:IMS import disulfide relay-system CHCH-CHCH-like Cx9C domain-containing protein n=1 Tax=Octopus bimaculoides TaxID=37653 RepID=A0A0L8H3P6_OCTBM|nr:coiled-coil-helix-coiled-coil-helix domain-containing protein 5 [Octopus bimaculoides]XP_014775709.1 coiled-coil-helix-coiled-coil-helix domain-containing protein 5 [Octopus bimaculoides]|eukprot:XP_014775708.1 PREDICTED: coiled-coil-helix-coiled-coil-helix domain-containing protein 5-like [Octopus bimaculoides]
MDSAMQVVLQQCGKYIQLYSTCVENYPETWHIDCELSRMKLAKCAESNPVVTRVKEQCTEKYEAYEKCLVSNPIQVQKCSVQLEKFNECANKVASEVQETSSS